MVVVAEGVGLVGRLSEEVAFHSDFLVLRLGVQVDSSGNRHAFFSSFELQNSLACLIMTLCLQIA